MVHGFNKFMTLVVLELGLLSSVSSCHISMLPLLETWELRVQERGMSPRFGDMLRLGGAKSPASTCGQLIFRV